MFVILLLCKIAVFEHLAFLFLLRFKYDAMIGGQGTSPFFEK